MEPLFNQWYAWSYLMAPHTAAMNILNLHLRIMKSYVASPQIHANAVNNPALLGGPFIDYNGGRVDEIRALMSRTMKEQSPLIQFAESIRATYELLAKEAQGFSLEPLYAKIPQNLKGYVELVYDLNNNPSIRFLEGLLYRSDYYQPELQTMSLSLVNQDSRPFVLSTPRLADRGTLELKLPFADPRLDALCSMKRSPRAKEEIGELLGLNPEQAELFDALITTEMPSRSASFDGEGVRIRYFGHA